ncbi:hypothetical protein POM88_035390 [Heracleum sosnowskyi]|uniref:NAC domain-containing protein n=1 Tax=Heracleum sosnowskyi TaxID=360622 RepID=A0AAD8HN21_9APIA|nr:hypothetical protein POM88_035390 [Heracleum sosnowskyi]
MDDDERLLAEEYVLLNSPEVQPYLKRYQNHVMRQRPETTPQDLDRIVKTRFKTWLKKKVKNDEIEGPRFKDLLEGPSLRVMTFETCRSLCFFSLRLLTKISEKLFVFVSKIIMSTEMSKVLTSSSSNKHVDAVVAEKEIGNNMPPGYYFLPSPSQLIQHYLVQKILSLPLASDTVKIMDVEHLDPEQLKLDEFKYNRDNEGYYITKKAERKTDVETTIKTTTGHWKESKSNSQICNEGSQIVGYKNTFTFYHADGTETAWRLNEYTTIPDIVPVDALTDTVQAKIEEYVACKIRFKKVKLPEEIIYDEEIEMDEDEDIYVD